MRASRLPLRVLRNSDKPQASRAASNQGAREGAGDFIVFLNPDTRVSCDALDRSLAFMADPANAAVGICGGRNVGEAGVEQVPLCALPDAMDARRQDDGPRAGVSAVDTQAAARRPMSFPIAGSSIR